LSGVHSFFYRRGMGRTAGPLPQVLLTTTGRKSGKPRTVALGALPQGDGWIVIGSFAGADVDPSWWLNLEANPQATLQVNDRVIDVRMQPITDEAEYARIWKEIVARAPNYAGYVRKTRRKIPLGRLRPVS
jgi:deazaflavin-dependent oxidoreductase (nitroreductase family)